MGRTIRALRVLALASAVASAGCVQMIEANVDALETLSRDSATDAETGVAIAVIGGTTAFLTGLGVAVSVATLKLGGSDAPPPEVVVEDELGWGFQRVGDEARWFRCTSRLLCTHQPVVEPAEAVLHVAPAGRGQPMTMDGSIGGEVDLVALRVRRRR